MPKTNYEHEFSIIDLTALLEKQEQSPCVSIYMPVNKKTVKENRVRFENLLKKSRLYLKSFGTGSSLAEIILAPAKSLLADPFFWQHQSDGLAFFATAKNSATYRLPMVLPELATAGNRFHFKPLFQFLSENGVFYLLALSQKNIRLYLGSRYGMNEIKPSDLPAELADILPNKDYEKLIQTHGSGSSEKSEFFHGHGGRKDAKKINLQKLFRKIDEKLHNLLVAKKNPLIIAGAGYFLPIYRQANTYPYLLEKQIEGNFDKPGAEIALYKTAWTIADSHFSESRIAAIDRYTSMKGTNIASNNFREIIPAAVNGLVETLIVAAGAHVWGIIDTATGQTIIHESEVPGDIDLLDFAAVHTFLHRGMLYVAKPAEMPDNAKAVAIARY